MVAQAYVVLDALPLGPNGKVDTRALPSPRAVQSSAPYVAPAGAREERLATIWQEVLGVARVGRDDDLFELGGHSLTVARIAPVRAELGIEISVAEISSTRTSRSWRRGSPRTMAPGRRAPHHPAPR